MRSCWVLAILVFCALVACSSTKKGEPCEDEGAGLGECDDGLACAREKSDETGRLICLKPCSNSDECEANEECNGIRGRNLQSCRPR